MPYSRCNFQEASQLFFPLVTRWPLNAKIANPFTVTKMFRINVKIQLNLNNFKKSLKVMSKIQQWQNG